MPESISNRPLPCSNMGRLDHVLIFNNSGSTTNDVLVSVRVSNCQHHRMIDPVKGTETIVSCDGTLTLSYQLHFCKRPPPKITQTSNSRSELLSRNQCKFIVPLFHCQILCSNSGPSLDSAAGNSFRDSYSDSVTLLISVVRNLKTC